MAYKHGIYMSEVPTSIVPPVQSSAGLPIVFGTAPIHLALNAAPVNKPVLCYSYDEAVAAFGYSEDWEKYTLCEFIYSQFALFNVAPVVLVNVLDPAVHKTASESAKNIPLTDGMATINEDGILLGSLTVKATAGESVLVKDKDYVAAYDATGRVVITALDYTGANVVVSYDKVKPDAVTHTDIIGGIDVTTGEAEGLELVNHVFPLFRLVPGQILAPGWSHNPAVAAVMVAKAGNINGHFRCLALTDVPTNDAKKYTDVAAWKEKNNYTSARQAVCWPMGKLGKQKFHLSTQLAGLICRTDASNDDIPYASPSNKNLQIDGLTLAQGKEVILGPDQAAYLNGQGIVTGLNFIGGWKAWGNRTGCYPGVTDPKDAFLPIRRMFDWIGNTIIQTYWQKVDYPVNRRLVQTITDSVNIWLNGLSAREFILGGRVEFLDSENPKTDLMDGIIRFHVYVTPPSPAREFDFILEYDPQYLQALFS